jgi:dUTP pyrophosphatase
MILTKDDLKKLCLEMSPPLLEGLIDIDVQIQPNGVDLTVKSVSEFQEKGTIGFSREELIIPNRTLITFNKDGWIKLPAGCYLVTFNEVVNLPTDLMAIGRPRSSMLRMGATVETAVWDAGFSGESQSLLIVNNRNGISISKNARVMQLVFIKLTKHTEAYGGGY